MIPQTIGIHLLLLPSPDHLIPTGAHALLEQAIHKECKKQRQTLYALHIHRDHVHVLVEDSTDNDAGVAITAILRASRKALQVYDSSLDFDDNVHVTLLPPWHLEIMSSFVRDQEAFHRRFTIAEEIEKVFLPNMIHDDAMVPS